MEPVKKNSKDLAVLLIDMQKNFLDNINDFKKEQMIFAQAEFLEFCNEFGIPVISLEYRGDGKTIPYLRERLKDIKDYENLKKDSNNGFKNKELDSILKEWGINKLVLMGINASWCVKETAKGALKRGYELFTSRDLIADKYNENSFYKQALNWYKQNGTYKKESADLMNFVSQLSPSFPQSP